MKPYFEDSLIRIYHGDCREILPSLGHFDLLLTDPPYGMNNNADYTRFSGGNTKRGKGTKKENIVGDDSAFDPSHLFEMDVDHRIIWGANHFWNKLPPGSALVWVKRNEEAYGTFLSDAEIAYSSVGVGVYCFTKVFSGSQKAIESGRKAYAPSAHPNQKPIALMSWCLDRVKGVKSMIDPYMGSGSSLIAAKNNGIPCVGIDIEERNCEVASIRSAQEVLALK